MTVWDEIRLAILGELLNARNERELRRLKEVNAALAQARTRLAESLECVTRPVGQCEICGAKISKQARFCRAHYRAGLKLKPAKELGAT